MIELYINGSLCDIDNSTVIAINKAVTDGVDKVKGCWTKSFTLPATPTNRRILGYVEILQSKNGIDKNTLAKAIIRNGIEIMKGRALVESVTINNTNYYEINIISGNKSWIAEIGEKTFADLDFSDGDFSYNISMIESLGNVRMPLMNFGEYKNHNRVLDFSNFRPAYKVGWILQKVFGLTDYGVQYPDFFDDLFIPHTAKFSLTDKTINNLHAKLYQDTDVLLFYQTSNPGVYQDISFNYELEDKGNHVVSSVYAADITSYLQFHITMTFRLKNPTNWNDTGYVSWGIMGSDGSFVFLGQSFGNSSGVGINGIEDDFVITKDIHVNSGVNYKLVANIVSNTASSTFALDYYNSFLEIERIDTFYYGDTIHLNDIMPKWSIKNFLKGLEQIFNLIYDVDETTNKVKIEIEDDYYASGSFRTLNIIKGTAKISWYDTAKETVFGYKKDTNDWAANQLEVNDSCIFDKTYSFLNKYTDKKEVKRNDFFAPTRMTCDDYIIDLPNITTPYMRKSETSGYESDGYEPRLLYFDSLKLHNYHVYISDSSTAIVSKLSICYSYYNPNDVLYPATKPIENLSFNKKYDIEGCLEKYHKNKLKRLDIGRILDISVKISIADFNEWSFRDTYIIDDADLHEINGNYHLLEIIDYNPDKDIVTIKLVQAFKTSDDYTPPATIDDEVNIKKSTTNGMIYKNGSVVIVEDGIEVVEMNKIGVTTEYDDLYYLDGNEVKPLYYIESQKLKRLKS